MKIKITILALLCIAQLGWGQGTYRDSLFNFVKADLKYVGKGGTCRSNGAKWKIPNTTEGKLLSAFLVENGKEPGSYATAKEKVTFRGRCYIISADEAAHGYSCLVINIGNHYESTIPACRTCILCGEKGHDVQHTSREVPCETAVLRQKKDSTATIQKSRIYQFKGKDYMFEKCDTLYQISDTTRLESGDTIIKSFTVFVACPDTIERRDTVRLGENPCATCDSVFRVENRGPITEIAWSPNSGAVKNWAGYLVKVGLQIPFHLLTKDSSCLHERLDLTLGMRSVTTQVTDPACGCSQVVQSAPIAWQLEAAYRFFYTPPSSKWRAGIGLGVTGLYRPLNFRTEYDEVKTLGVQAFLEPRLEWRFNKQLAAFVSSRYSFGSNILNENPLSFSLGGRFGIQGRDKRGRKG